MKATQTGQHAEISSDVRAYRELGRTLEWMADYFAERSKGGTIQAVLSRTYISHARPDRRKFRSWYGFDYDFVRQIGIRPLYGLISQSKLVPYFNALFRNSCRRIINDNDYIPNGVFSFFNALDDFNKPIPGIIYDPLNR